MAGMTGMQIWMTGLTGMTRIAVMTKTTMLTGMTGVTGVIRMTTVNGLTVITRTTGIVEMTAMQVWETGMTGIPYSSYIRHFR